MKTTNPVRSLGQWDGCLLRRIVDQRDHVIHLVFRQAQNMLVTLVQRGELPKCEPNAFHIGATAVVSDRLHARSPITARTRNNP